MKYEIAYISASGNTEKLAHGIADMFPARDTYFTDLSAEKITGQADIYLICFGFRKEAVPLKVLELLEELENKTILFFVTASVKPSDEAVGMLERYLEPFMPSSCDYRGLFLCPGQVSAHTLESVQDYLRVNPDDEQAKEVYAWYQSTAGHPNENDVGDACNFIREKLSL